VNGPQSLDLGVFAIVMGTGIVAVDMRNHDLPAVSLVLVAVAVVAYVLLLVLMLWRVIAFPAAVGADLADPGRGFGRANLRRVGGRLVRDPRYRVRDGRHSIR
jgi:tellurite resistance protein TehA-like permease